MLYKDHRVGVVLSLSGICVLTRAILVIIIIILIIIIIIIITIITREVNIEIRLEERQ